MKSISLMPQQIGKRMIPQMQNDGGSKEEEEEEEEGKERYRKYMKTYSLDLRESRAGCLQDPLS